MEFVVTSNVPPDALTKLGPTGQIHSVGAMTIVSTDSSEIAGSRYLFDGQTSKNGRFFHSLLPDSRRGMPDLIDRTVADQDFFFPAGLFCAAKVDADKLTLFTESLTQYPVYYYQKARKWVISNHFPWIAAIVDRLETGLNRRIDPCLENIVTGGVYSAQTHAEGVYLLPFGHRLVATGGRIELIPLVLPDAGSYSEALEEARRSISEHIETVASAVRKTAVIATDLTGGSDSRCVLSFLLKSSLAERTRIRCLTQVPHPDGIVASRIAKASGLGFAPFPMVQTVPHAHKPEFMSRVNASLYGGGRIVTPPALATAFSDLVHFKGSFGEIGGATPGSDHVGEIKKTGDYSAEAFAEALFRRRKSAKALTMLAAGALASVRATIVEKVRELELLGFEPDHLQAEIYLRTRCRSHFGWPSAADNRNHILPEILANYWIVAARRMLGRNLHTKNKVMFDLMVANNPQLTFFSMAGKKWSSEIVPQHLHPHLEAMVNIDASSELPTDRVGDLFVPVSIPDDTYADFKPLTDGTYQGLHEFMLGSAPDPHWETFERAFFLEYPARTSQVFSANNIESRNVTSAMAALLWQLKLDMAPKLTGRVHEFSRMMEPVPPS